MTAPPNVATLVVARLRAGRTLTRAGVMGIEGEWRSTGRIDRVGRSRCASI